MKTLNTLVSEAVAKLQAGKDKVSGNKEKAMAGAVLSALKDFCRQNEEFARAVVTGDGFDQCMKKVAEGIGSSISDLEAYKKAVRFYFPGAEIKMQLTINLEADDNESIDADNDFTDSNHDTPDNTPGDEPEAAQTIVLNLMDYFK